MLRSTALDPVHMILDSLSPQILEPIRCQIFVRSHETAAFRIALLMLLHERTFHSNDGSLRNIGLSTSKKSTKLSACQKASGVMIHRIHLFTQALKQSDAGSYPVYRTSTA